MTKPTHRWFALLIPAVGQFLVWLIAIYTRRNTIRHDESLEYLLLLTVTMVVCIVLLQRAPLNSFWKTHLFAVSSAVIPTVVMFNYATAVYGTGGYWWLGIMSFGALMIIASVVTLPVTWLVLWIIRQRQIQRYQ